MKEEEKQALRFDWKKGTLYITIEFVPEIDTLMIQIEDLVSSERYGQNIDALFLSQNPSFNIQQHVLYDYMRENFDQLAITNSDIKFKYVSGKAIRKEIDVSIKLVKKESFKITAEKLTKELHSMQKDAKIKAENIKQLEQKLRQSEDRFQKFKIDLEKIMLEKDTQIAQSQKRSQNYEIQYRFLKREVELKDEKIKQLQQNQKIFSKQLSSIGRFQPSPTPIKKNGSKEKDKILKQSRSQKILQNYPFQKINDKTISPHPQSIHRRQFFFTSINSASAKIQRRDFLRDGKLCNFVNKARLFSGSIYKYRIRIKLPIQQIWIGACTASVMEKLTNYKNPYSAYCVCKGGFWEGGRGLKQKGKGGIDEIEVEINTTVKRYIRVTKNGQLLQQSQIPLTISESIYLSILMCEAEIQVYAD